MKRMISVALAALILLLSGCTSGGQPTKTEYTKFSTQFYGTFDTIVQIVGYCKTEDEFVGYAEQIKERFIELNNLYDIYYDYSGVNNIKTINDNAGIAPVAVSEEILDLLEFSLEWYDKTEGQVNIALGPVLSVWHSYMSLYAGGSEDSEIPSVEKLRAAMEHTDISKVIIDREAGTVYLEEKGMSLDVGAVAKGYATQLVCEELYAAGFTSFIISAGGNVVAMDPPLDGVRNSWGVGIQDPFTAEDLTGSSSLDVAYVTKASVVTSGDYQRYYMYGDQRIHHIIDPTTLMPSDHYRAVTIITEDSGIADLASTTLFTLPYEESSALAERMGWKVLWVLADGTVKCNDAMTPVLRERGGATGLLE